MKTTDHDLRVCPTRIDGSPVLFAHKVDRSKCQERQRQGYHKCFSCAHNNNFVGAKASSTRIEADRPKSVAKVG